MVTEIYEVTAVVNGQLLDFDLHIDRLFRSADAIALEVPYTRAEWRTLHERLISDNGVDEGIVYVQLTLGTTERAFTFHPEISPVILRFTQEKSLRKARLRR